MQMRIKGQQHFLQNRFGKRVTVPTYNKPMPQSNETPVVAYELELYRKKALARKLKQQEIEGQDYDG